MFSCKSKGELFPAAEMIESARNQSAAPSATHLARGEFADGPDDSDSFSSIRRHGQHFHKLFGVGGRSQSELAKQK